MTRYLSVDNIIRLHQRIIKKIGGLGGVRDVGLLYSAIAKVRQTFGSEELFPTLVEKAAVLGFSIIKNHPFIDGNKRTGHAALVVLLKRNGHTIKADLDEQEEVILQVASGELNQDQFTDWLRAHVVKKESSFDISI